MTLDWIKEPISKDDPAGPDLWETDDPVFNEYYFDAAGRLPEADDYAKIGLAMGDGDKLPDVIFNPKSVSLSQETGQIDALLKRSRDLRLLTMRAQWSILAGDIEETSASVTAMADLLEEMPVEVHPVIDGPPRDRLEAINDLSATGAMILPLRYLDIGGTGTSLRRVMVARGKVTPHDGEDDLSIDAMVGAMSKSREAVEQTHTALTQFSAALTRIENACLSSETPHTPQLKTLAQEISAVLAVIAEAEPDLDKNSEGAGTDVSEGTSPAAAESNAPTWAAPPATEVKSHDEARRRLVAVETYFGKHEPSSAAVLLVTQSRLLIGKSLVDAFDILMPESAQRAAVDFISDSGFKLAHQQLRDLADQVLVEESTAPEQAVISEPEPPAPEPEPEPETADQSQEDSDADGTDTENDDADQVSDESAEQDVPDVAEVIVETPTPVVQPADDQTFIVSDAGVAASQILAVETYFRAREKSSPIPMLLSRARSYIGKDFETLLKELVPKIDY